MVKVLAKLTTVKAVFLKKNVPFINYNWVRNRNISSVPVLRVARGR